MNGTITDNKRDKNAVENFLIKICYLDFPN